MIGLLMLAAAAQGGGAEAAFRAWRACIGETTRVAAQAGRLPEEMPPLLRESCPDQKARFLDTAAKGGGERGRAAGAARGEALVNNYVRRYAVFYTTGLWPER